MQVPSRQRHQLLCGLKWIEAHLGHITHTLEVRAPHSMTTALLCRSPGLKEALLSKACTLMCFIFEKLHGWPSDAGYSAEPEEFPGWVLEQARQIEAVKFLGYGVRLGACPGRLQNLKHLEMDGYAFTEEIKRDARLLLPSLETLYLHEERLWPREELDLLGCQHLKHLVVEGAHAPPVLHEPECGLGRHVSSFALRFLPERQAPEATPDSVPRPNGYADAPPKRAVEALTLRAMHWDTCTFQLREISGWSNNLEEEALLKGYMPAIVPQPPAGSRHAWSNLKSLVLWARGAINCCIPRGLPNLEEVVLLGHKAAEVLFEDPVAIFSTVKTFYIFGQPLTTDMDSNIMRHVSDNLAGRGLLISTMSSNSIYRAETEHDVGSLCMYVRPSSEPELSHTQLYDRVRTLAGQCRCKACFECLRRAGTLTYDKNNLQGRA